MTKAIIFDASTLISFAMNGLLPELKELAKKFDGKFIIPMEVKSEIIDKPIEIKRFELEALKLKSLLDEKIIHLPTILGIDESKISEITKEFMDKANSIFLGKEGDIHLIDHGEAACLALGKLLDEKKISNLLAIDERTTRMLVEKPTNLQKLLEKKLKMKIKLKKDNFIHFKGFKIIRSTELIYIAYKKGLVRLKGELVLDALLWALKFKGCSITGEEINEIKQLR